MRRWLTSAVAFAAACSFDSEADGAGTANIRDDTGSTSAAADTADSTPSVPAQTSAASGTGSGASSSPDPTTTAPSSGSSDESSAGGSGSDAGPVSYPESCAAILTGDPAAVSGIFDIAPPGTTLETPIPVYCDMDTDGGGWTLVGRSLRGDFDSGQFGWAAARGDVEDMSRPYSLNASAAALRFEQVLVGNHAGSMAWRSRIYRLDVGAEFMTNTDNSITPDGITTIDGDCDPNGGPRMLRRVGYTGATSLFYFRDVSGYEPYGLGHGRFDMYEPSSFLFPCSHGAELHEDEGMVMVR